MNVKKWEGKMIIFILYGLLFISVLLIGYIVFLFSKEKNHRVIKIVSEEDWSGRYRHKIYLNGKLFKENLEIEVKI